MNGDAGDGDVSSEVGDGEPIIGDDMHGDDMNGNANNMEIDKENNNEKHCADVEDWIQFAQLNVDGLDVESGLANTQWVANDCEEMVKDVKIVTPADIITRIRRAYGVNISYYTAWNAKRIYIQRITGCFDEGYSIMQELCRQEKGKNWNVNYVVPRAKTHIEEMKKCCNQYTPQGVDANKWVAISKVGKKWRADLIGKTCDCYEWQISGLPCVHTLYVIMMRMDWVGFCSEYHMVAAYRRSYKGSMLPISDPSLWENPNSDMLPPPLEEELVYQERIEGGVQMRIQLNSKKNVGSVGSRPRNNPPTRVGVGIGVGIGVEVGVGAGVGMRGRGTRGGVARGSVAGGGDARARQQSTNNPRGGVNNVRGGLTGGRAVRVHTQASQQSTNNARGGLTRGRAARVHTQASQQSANNVRGGLTRGRAARVILKLVNKVQAMLEEEEDDDPEMDGEKKDGSDEDEGSDNDGGDGWQVGDEDEGSDDDDDDEGSDDDDDDDDDDDGGDMARWCA
ncbi:hypothetical protein GIB67_017029 [Kingdonia uniflora]|uniref:SWIM-type domain-containing protein n=1 Tax=Kingdonia uniflora TaxID=39325 RepID=A0A7J7MK18_9MAGN|nr:hypothetical protein GIB67_017029 [Kingdonia uniflora]